jgi:DNA-binding MarR family transcriptional regulator
MDTVTRESSPDTLDELVDLFSSIARYSRSRLMESLEPLSIAPGAARALAEVVHHPSIRMSELAGALGVSARSVTSVIDQLVEAGLVLRVADPADRRAVRLVASERGIELHRGARNCRRAVGQEIFDSLSPARRAELVSILADLKTKLEARGQ